MFVYFRLSILTHCSIPVCTKLLLNKNYCYQGFIAFLNILWGESGTSLFALLFQKYLGHVWFFILPYTS